MTAKTCNFGQYAGQSPMTLIRRHDAFGRLTIFNGGMNVTSYNPTRKTRLPERALC